MSETHNDEKTVLSMFGSGIGGTYDNTPGNGSDFRSAPPMININDPQPMPAGGTGPDIWELVIEDMRGRNALGTATYGGPLRVFDGRINLVDLYQELLDAVCYLRKEIEERRFRPDINLNTYAAACHQAAAQWWKCLNCDGTGTIGLDIKCDPCNGTGKADRDVPKLLMLVVSELSEAMEGHRKDLMDDHLPTRKMFEVELADALIRIFDLVGAHGLDIEGAYREKQMYNAARADHKPEARQAAGGKKY